MKELKKRIKGLSAILLAVCLALCLVVRFSGVSVSAEIKDSITIGDNTVEISDQYTAEDAIAQKIITRKLSVTGGTFSISGDVSGKIIYCDSEDKKVDVDSNFSYAKINTASGYDGFMITSSNKQTESGATKYTFTLQFVKQPSTEGGVGVGTYYMTSGTQYSFPSGNTHKVQGDPTVYYGASFYVSSSGTYTIEQ